MDSNKQRVREFYDEVGWAQDADGLFQNARFEDLRPVSRDYVHRCHLRVGRHLRKSGKFFLDAGSGPVQWPDYLDYSVDFQHRVCVDISITALRAAKAKLAGHGLMVVGDIASLPFRAEAFDAAVSMHAIHHLPASEHAKAYAELLRVLRPGTSAVAVNGWYRPLLMRMAEPMIRLGRWLAGRQRKVRKRDAQDSFGAEVTFVEKVTPRSLRRELKGRVPIEILPWRSLSPRFMQWFVREGMAGKLFLRAVYGLEERFPGFFGLHGQYPMVVIRKPAAADGIARSAVGHAA